MSTGRLHRHDGHETRQCRGVRVTAAAIIVLAPTPNPPSPLVLHTAVFVVYSSSGVACVVGPSADLMITFTSKTCAITHTLANTATT